MAAKTVLPSLPFPSGIYGQAVSPTRRHCGEVQGLSSKAWVLM